MCACDATSLLHSSASEATDCAADGCDAAVHSIAAAAAALLSHFSCRLWLTCALPGRAKLISSVSLNALAAAAAAAAACCYHFSLFLQAVADLRAAGKSENEIEKFSVLFTEVRQQIDSKQLRPFIRTQYMRTAFQVRLEDLKLLDMLWCVSPMLSAEVFHPHAVHAHSLPGEGSAELCRVWCVWVQCRQCCGAAVDGLGCEMLCKHSTCAQPCR
jgi:hypothetical protein